jgi:hypothetical protein
MAAHDQNGQDGAAEQIHLPGPSLIPFFTAAGITLALVGLVLSWWFVWAGSTIVLISIVRWISVVRQDIASLPTEHRR